MPTPIQQISSPTSTLFSPMSSPGRRFRCWAALAAGQIGIDSAEVIVKGLNEVIRHTDPEVLLLAERVLVANATGALNDDTAGLPGSSKRISLRGYRLGQQ